MERERLATKAVRGLVVAKVHLPVLTVHLRSRCSCSCWYLFVAMPFIHLLCNVGLLVRGK
jgi:hypothetical protein